MRILFDEDVSFPFPPSNATCCKQHNFHQTDKQYTNDNTRNERILVFFIFKIQVRLKQMKNMTLAAINMFHKTVFPASKREREKKNVTKLNKNGEKKNFRIDSKQTET